MQKGKVKFGAMLWAFFRFLLVFGLCYVILKPFATKILSAFMSRSDLLDATVKYVPKQWSLFFWKHAWEHLQLSTAGVKSLRLAIISAVLQMITSTMIGYGLARFKFKGRNLLFVAVILIIIIPQQVYSIPQYLGFRFFGIGDLSLNLLDTDWPVYILAATGLAMKQCVYVYLMREIFMGMPSDLENAAAVDGASVMGTFTRIVLPNARTMMVTVFLFAFCWQWTDIRFSSLFFTDHMTLTQVVAAQNQMAVYTDSGVLDRMGTAIAQNAAAILVILPLVALAVICQKFLVQSIAQSGLAN